MVETFYNNKTSVEISTICHVYSDLVRHVRIWLSPPPLVRKYQKWDNPPSCLCKKKSEIGYPPTSYVNGPQLVQKCVFYSNNFFFTSYYSYLQTSKVESINYKKILQGKYLNRHWSQNLQFCVWNGLKLPPGKK